MTGEKTKAKPLDKLWNLDDKQLKTPEHDKLVCWLLDKENIKKIFPTISNSALHRVYFCNTEISKENGNNQYTIYYFDKKLEKGFNWENNDSVNIQFGDTKKLYNNIFQKTKLNKNPTEEDIINSDIYVDKENITNENVSKYKTLIKELYTLIIQDYNLLIEQCENINDFIKVDAEEIIKNKYNNFVIGFWDVSISFDMLISTQIFSCESRKPLIYKIEVKPKIDSFGATLRQINLYKEFTKGSYETILFTPDTRFDSQFESQGIRVIHPPKGWDTL